MRLRSRVQSRIEQLSEQINEVIVGKSEAIKLAVTCLLARGHLLIEDIPGVGKTTLSQALARSSGLSFQRIQFTSDLLPADILGNSIYDTKEGRFVFHPGPIFSGVVLIDEINRATPKTQSALLEVMEEHQVSVDGKTHALPEPFFVIATQNPREQIGTFPLPESQLDRFMMRISLGYPDRASEREVLTGVRRRVLLDELGAVFDAPSLRDLQQAVERVHVSDQLLDYLQDLLEASREIGNGGLSPRAGLACLRAARAWAHLSGRDVVWPEDLQQLAPPVMGHRLGGHGGEDQVTRLIESVEVPV
jgi:MoxR-like ATPase